MFCNHVHLDHISSEPSTCKTWKDMKMFHFFNTKKISASRDLSYLADQLSDEEDFMHHLKRILIPRVPGSRGHRRVREYIVRSMERLGYAVEEHKASDMTPLGVKDFTNVIATLDPEAPRRMVIACHYDSLMKALDSDSEGFLGATDSAVPCAQMINMANTMRQDLENLKSRGPELTLQFIFFDGEEAFVKWSDTDSLYGSRALAEYWGSKAFQHDGVEGNFLDRIDIFVLLDLIGTSDTSFMKLMKSTSNWYDRLVAIESDLRRSTNRVSGKMIFMDESQIPSTIEDDHIPFQKRGVPIINDCHYFPLLQ